MIMRELKIKKFGETIELLPEEIEKLFTFAQRFDIFDGKPTDEFMFDTRDVKAIHWLDTKTKRILSSVYKDEIENKIKIVGGTEGGLSWDEKTASEKWTKLFNMAIEMVIIKKE